MGVLLAPARARVPRLRRGARRDRGQDGRARGHQQGRDARVDRAEGVRGAVRPDVRRPAGHHEDPGGRPAGRHRRADPRADRAVRAAAQLDRAGRGHGEHGPVDQREPADRAARGPGGRAHRGGGHQAGPDRQGHGAGRGRAAVRPEDPGAAGHRGRGEPQPEGHRRQQADEGRAAVRAGVPEGALPGHPQEARHAGAGRHAAGRTAGAHQARVPGAAQGAARREGAAGRPAADAARARREGVVRAGPAQGRVPVIQRHGDRRPEGRGRGRAGGRREDIADRQPGVRGPAEHDRPAAEPRRREHRQHTAQLGRHEQELVRQREGAGEHGQQTAGEPDRTVHGLRRPGQRGNVAHLRHHRTVPLEHAQTFPKTEHRREYKRLLDNAFYPALRYVIGVVFYDFFDKRFLALDFRKIEMFFIFISYR